MISAQQARKSLGRTVYSAHQNAKDYLQSMAGGIEHAENKRDITSAHALVMRELRRPYNKRPGSHIMTELLKANKEKSVEQIGAAIDAFRKNFDVEFPPFELLRKTPKIITHPRFEEFTERLSKVYEGLSEEDRKQLIDPNSADLLKIMIDKNGIDKTEKGDNLQSAFKSLEEIYSEADKQKVARYTFFSHGGPAAHIAEYATHPKFSKLLKQTIAATEKINNRHNSDDGELYATALKHFYGEKEGQEDEFGEFNEEYFRISDLLKERQAFNHSYGFHTVIMRLLNQGHGEFWRQHLQDLEEVSEIEDKELAKRIYEKHYPMLLEGLKANELSQKLALRKAPGEGGKKQREAIGLRAFLPALSLTRNEDSLKEFIKVLGKKSVAENNAAQNEFGLLFSNATFFSKEQTLPVLSRFFGILDKTGENKEEENRRLVRSMSNLFSFKESNALEELNKKIGEKPSLRQVKEVIEDETTKLIPVFANRLLENNNEKKMHARISLQKIRESFLEEKPKPEISDPHFALSLINPLDRPNAFLRLYEDLKDSSYAHFDKRQWETHAKQLSARENDIKEPMQ